MLLRGAACLMSLAVATAGMVLPAAPARAAVPPSEGSITQLVADNDVAERPTSRLAGSVYEDLNDNGMSDTGEDGISGVTVTLTGTNIDGDPVSLEVTSEADGTYEFTGLLPGTYDVTESQPDDHLDGTDTAGSAGGTVTPPDSITGIELTGGETATGYLFGESPGAAIAGAVTDDEGVGIAGVTLTLTDAAGTPIGDPVVTDALGDYTFTLLLPGTYTVTETQPAGYGDGGEHAGSAGGTVTNDQVSGIVLRSGVRATGYDFDETRGSLAGVVYQDRNNNGVRDAGEAGIPDAVVSLTGTDAAGDPVTRQATTDPNGEYVFAGLLAGTYVVIETQPPGYLDGKDAAGTAGGRVTPPDSITGVVLAPARNATGYRFGELVSTSISGAVVDDADTGIAGVTITLTGTDDNGNVVTMKTATGVDGNYSFTRLRPGSYTVTETQPAGYGDGADSVGSAGGVLGNDVISGIDLDPRTMATDYDFAETRGSLAGSVYVDTDSDGVRDPREKGIAGAEVTLRGKDDAGNTIDRAVTTANDGTYTFPGLLSGTYEAVETQAYGYLDGGDAAGDAGGTVTPPDAVTGIVLQPGKAARGYTFGELRGASIAGGVVDDDAGIPDVTITLTGTDDNGDPVESTTTTDDEGTWLFVALRPGTYAVTETQPVGYGDGADTPGDAGGDAGGDTFTGIVLGFGQSATGYQFAETRLAEAQPTTGGDDTRHS